MLPKFRAAAPSPPHLHAAAPHAAAATAPRARASPHFTAPSARARLAPADDGPRRPRLRALRRTGRPRRRTAPPLAGICELFFPFFC